MSRYRSYPSAEQAEGLLRHCGHARFVWNLAVEQAGYRHHGQRVPGYAEQDRQLTEARATFGWLGAGSSTVQQQALRDHQQALKNWWGGTHKRPTWRKRGRHEGFRIVCEQALRVRRVNRRWSQVLVPKIGWVRFRRTRPVPDARSYRVRRDAAGRWHIAFAHVPAPVAGPGTGQVVGVDRGVAVSAMTSGGEVLRVPGLSAGEARRLARLRRKAGRQRVPGTSLMCSACKHVDRNSRKSQAAFRCTACGFACHADLNAALNIAAGRAVTARGASPWGEAGNREPQHVTSSVG